MMSSFPMVSFLITLLLAAAVCTHGNEQVRDTAGNPVQVREQYFIQPVRTKSNNGGGLYPTAIKVPPLCPLGITQSLPLSQGLPVIFHYPTHIDSSVNTSVDVNIEHIPGMNGLDCPEYSRLWAVPLGSNEPAIFLAGSQQSANSQFKIEKAGTAAEDNTYKLTSLSGTVGATTGNSGVPHLVLTSDDAKTLLVRFNKVLTPPTSRVDKLGLRMFPFY